MSFSEREWRVLRSVHATALERYCARVLDECATVIQDASASPHDRYLRLFRLLQDRDERVATAFNDLRRSTAIQRLASMIRLDAVTEEELSQFSPETRNTAIDLADIWGRPSKKRRGAK